MRRIDQKIVLVTRATQMAALRKKFSTASQARFQIVSSRKRELARAMPAQAIQSADLEEMAEQEYRQIEGLSAKYDQSVQQLRGDLDLDSKDYDLPVQAVDRDFLPNFVFGPNDIVVTVGQDGLVANVAKYAVGLPIVAVNPDPASIDGVLLPFRPDQAKAAVRAVLAGKARYREVTLAEANLPDGQRLLAFNELFIGNRTHVSARYRLTIDGRTEPQSSSGLLVCTGAGSTGWLSSVLNMAAGVAAQFGIGPATNAHQNHNANAPSRRAPSSAQPPLRLEWEDPRLAYVVREPFVSKSSRADLIAGLLDAGQELTVESDMANNGVIFSDGVESDYLEFNAGATARIRTAAGKAKLVVG
jgi:NAD kinase